MTLAQKVQLRPQRSRLLIVQEVASRRYHTERMPPQPHGKKGQARDMALIKDTHRSRQVCLADLGRDLLTQEPGLARGANHEVIDRRVTQIRRTGQPFVEAAGRQLAPLDNSVNVHG
ncbi:hypothetical protein [Thiorhodococcus fuscus]|uniref:Transposase n=1 Tax=Thiorhodococcus fuscus TaxID=527200 RepID=A0ABW4YBF9_9GAMM